MEVSGWENHMSSFQPCAKLPEGTPMIQSQQWRVGKKYKEWSNTQEISSEIDKHGRPVLCRYCVLKFWLLKWTMKPDCSTIFGRWTIKWSFNGVKMLKKNIGLGVYPIFTPIPGEETYHHIALKWYSALHQLAYALVPDLETMFRDFLILPWKNTFIEDVQLLSLITSG